LRTRRPEHRDPLLKFLNTTGIDAKCHYPIAIHQQEGYPWGRLARINSPISNSERNAASCISLPIFPELAQDEIDFVIEKTVEWDKAAG
jgi:dTDP-4-amino-4,6-dideoxygalactose transaminase